MSHILLYLCFGLLLICQCSAKSKEEWKSRIIYQLLTDRFATENGKKMPCNDLRSYCGGSFRGIAEKLDYISGLGANAIWISPIVENTPKGYHGYWAKDIYSINPHFGSEKDLQSLITECHKRDIWVMVDVVANHMGYNDGCCLNINCNRQQLVNFTGFNPFNETDHYHDLCEIENWKNQTEVEICRLAKLPDLNQTNEYVRSTLLNWIRDLTQKYKIDGYRIDTVTEVAKDFWMDFQIAAGAYCVGEVNNGDNMTYVAEYQGPLNAVLNFPVYWSLRKVFTENQPMTLLKTTLERERTLFKDVTVLGNFLDNHDFQRFLNLSPHTTLLMNAITYIILGQGIPIIYYGTEQLLHGGNDPENREALWPNYNTSTKMYKYIKAIANFRKDSEVDFSSDPQSELYADDDYLIFSRGNKHEILVFLCNKVKEAVYTKTFNIKPYKDGAVLENIFNKTDRIQIVNSRVEVEFHDNMPELFQLVDTGTNRMSKC